MSTLLRTARSLFTPYAFHKTHKTGGTTLQNILLRHARRHGLNVLMPTRKHAFRPDDTVEEAERRHKGIEFQVCAA